MTPSERQQVFIVKHIDVNDADELAIAQRGLIRACRLPDGTRFRYLNKHRATDKEPEYFVGVKTCGVTGPGEGVMAQFDHDKPDFRQEISPWQEVEPLLSDVSVESSNETVVDALIRSARTSPSSEETADLRMRVLGRMNLQRKET